MTKSEEEVFSLWSKLDGTEVHTKGWPDFLVVGKNGRPLAIEVKRPGEKLKPHQKRVHEILAMAGIETLVIYSDGDGLYLCQMIENLTAMIAEHIEGSGPATGMIQ